MTIREASDITGRTPEDTYGLSLGDAGRIIWKRLPIILLVAVVLTALVVGLGQRQTPVFEASSKALIVEERQKNAADQPLSSQVDGLNQLAVVITQVADSQRVAEATIQRLNLNITPDELVNHLSATQVSETPFIEIKYEDSNPEMARRIVNTVPEVLPGQLSDVNLGTTGAITAKVFDPASTPSTPVSPNPLRNGFVAFVIGLMLGVGLAFLLDYRDNSWRSPEEVEIISGVPTYALIPRHKSSAAARRSASSAVSSERSIHPLSEGEAPNGKREKP
jgi:capsular polysaccharide biosynthesis protein